ncbi:pyridoxal-phosphate-dependent aminotransferase family protein [Desulfovibrio litoralis]|uniref:Aspartate aminotransferase n=1 Tax=Desulfovibrio litoralis DSM 11393 TaxID=1121455 RepID=A0A1M7RTR5_9BACT|nr:alanine--glyoxylate aminotransferase family protein [Desulfovibrio litoralis]SHN49432.1 aspartate aminotransferase [Desulfovibrio litoralis DSM 11393]
MLNKPRLLTPGPTQLPERVRLAMAVDMIHHRKAPFKAILSEVQTHLKTLFGTNEAVLPLACSGSGAMTAAVTNLFAPGQKVLIIDGGKFAQRWIDIAKMRGLSITVLTVEWGNGVDPNEVKALLNSEPDFAGVLMQLSETSTGALHPVRQIAAITRKTNTLLVVDGISGVSISPCPMDEWGIDCLVTGSQKGLMLPPGLALIALSKRAWEKNATVPISDFYFNLASEKKNNLTNQTSFTTPVSMIVGLNESLKMFAEFGLKNVYQKQWALTQMTRTGVKALGFELFAKDNYAWGVTAIKMPVGMSATKLVAYMAENFNIVMATGQDEYKDTVIRLGHMGWVDWSDVLAGLHALAYSFVALGGYIGCKTYCEQALDAYHKALAEDYNIVL